MVAKFRDRACIKCGQVEINTASRADICLSCYWQERSATKIDAEKERVRSLYGNVCGPSYDTHNKRCYTFTHSCGTTQTCRYDNLLKQLKSISEPCIKCGGLERQKKAIAGYVDKYKLDERARTDLRAYTRKVRGISEKTYRENLQLLNPNNLKRQLGNQGYHLDHIVSIVECFKRGWSPEKAGELENLQLLEASVNLSKGRRSSKIPVIIPRE